MAEDKELFRARVNLEALHPFGTVLRTFKFALVRMNRCHGAQGCA
jgi:hypothetical protein